MQRKLTAILCADVHGYSRLMEADKEAELGIWLLLDEAPAHTAENSLALAASLAIELVWLPKQCSELNAMDHLWKKLKRGLAANRQFRTIDEGAEHAEH